MAGCWVQAAVEARRREGWATLGGGHAVDKEHLSLLTQVRFLRRELMGKERWNYK